MAQEPEVLREQIRETQESLVSKLSTLEDKVVSTVTNTTESVTETVENVKETVAETVGAVKDTLEETIESVKRTFDLELQVREHPWLMMAGSCAAGFLAGRLLPGAARHAEDFVEELATGPMPQASSFSSAEGTPLPNGSQRPRREGWLTQLAHQYHEEIEQVKGLALGALFGLARDWAAQNLPSNLAPQVKEIIESLTAKVGGTHIESPVAENVFR
jgi:ElaB/YqjD/DUF883 family membrane-anchored ribosome-binding protein